MGADETRIGELVHDCLQRAADGELAVRVNDGLIPEHFHKSNLPERNPEFMAAGEKRGVAGGGYK